MIIPRDYQAEAVTSMYGYFQRHPLEGNPLVAMPTGTGKGVVIAVFLESVLRQWPNQRIMILTHVKELIEQNYLKLLQAWPNAPAGVYSAGLNRRDIAAQIIFAGIGSVAKRAPEFGHVDLVLIDEAHLVSPHDTTMYQTFLAALAAINPRLRIIGFTATPWRLGHGKLTDPHVKPDGTEVEPMFTDMCFDITGVEAFNRLIAEGYLSPLIPKKTEMLLEVDGVHMRGGEFIQKELQYAVDKWELTEAAVKEALEHGASRAHWMVFAAGVEHVIHTAEVLNHYGVNAVAVHSKMKSKERDDAIAGFKAGYYRAAVNNNILTTGFDFPGIDMILGLRPTASSVLWGQMLGRGTRPVYAPGYDLTDISGRLSAIEASQKHNCLVLDFAGNTKRLGPINDPVIPRRKGKGTGDAPIKLCPECNTYVHASLRYCDGIKQNGERCGHEFTFETKLHASASTEEIIKGEMPIVEVVAVDHITFSQHNKLGRPPSIKVSYYCGLQVYNEFVCPEHEAWARRKAETWWRLRSDTTLPGTTAEALELVGNVQAPSHLRVWVNKKYPEIMAACFDGTAFGTQEVSDSWLPPTADVEGQPVGGFEELNTTSRTTQADDWDDDIPF